MINKLDQKLEHDLIEALLFVHSMVVLALNHVVMGLEELDLTLVLVVMGIEDDFSLSRDFGGGRK